MWCSDQETKSSHQALRKHGTLGLVFSDVQFVSTKIQDLWFRVGDG